MELSANHKLIVERPNKRVYEDGERVIKVFNSTKPVSDVFNEALNLARINEVGIKSPEVIEVAYIEDNGWAIATKRIEGTTLAALMEEDPVRYYEYLERFVDLQISVHAQQSSLLPRARDKYRRMIEGLDALNATQRYDLLQRLDGMGSYEHVCHGDFNPTNVIVDANDELWVCDWAHATQGAPAADAAMTYLLLALNDRSQATAYLELFCEKADVPMQVVRRWTSIVAASELARARADQDADFLMGWIDVFDYQ
ncbi:phosphotransferase [Collinsella sp. zg1085]|uniref:phosphotransferase family protein n=1 Tax=Collinsella sp. zg1085 TaxID=2844380 RepID=UPI001C0B5FDD|nr:aminoglycoside phosphotransferase family protein [Collinsella sp. zg1085]QWT17132.1 phosphotransferase [Collinsella sp. zg1085]